MHGQHGRVLFDTELWEPPAVIDSRLRILSAHALMNSSGIEGEKSLQYLLENGNTGRNISQGCARREPCTE